MNRKIILSMLMSIMFVSIAVVVPALQTTLNNVETKMGPKFIFEKYFSPFAEKVPEPIRSKLTKIASMQTDLAPKSTVTIQSPEWSENITVRRYEFILLIVDKNFAPVKPQWLVGDSLYYVADSLYAVAYSIYIDEGTDPEFITLTDIWKKGMSWGEGVEVSKPYYLWGWGTNITDAGPWNYDSKTGTFSVTFNPDAGPTEYQISFLFLAKTGFINQFATKPKVSCVLSPKTAPPLKAGEFYDVWLKMSKFKVKGLPLYTYVWMYMPSWQSTENGVYIKNMDPQISMLEWWGADPPDVPGPEWGISGWYYDNRQHIPSIDPSFPDCWVQFSFQKSAVTPAPNEGNYLFDGGVTLMYANKGFGIITGDNPQLILSPEDLDISVTTGLMYNVWTQLTYYFEEPKPTILEW